MGGAQGPFLKVPLTDEGTGDQRGQRVLLKDKQPVRRVSAPKSGLFQGSFLIWGTSGDNGFKQLNNKG